MTESKSLCEYVRYEDEFATLYQGDAAVLLPLLAKASADLLLTDPPYGVEFESNRRGESFGGIVGDDAFPVELVNAAFRVLRPFRHAYIFGARPDQYELPLGGQSELIWDKEMRGMGDLTAPWGPQHEPILFGVYAPSKANRARGDGRLAARMRKGSILRAARKNATGAKHHPTEKPVSLLCELIESSSVPGDVILDPFAGAGSTLVAATLEGRRSIGIEIEGRYCEIAATRLAHAATLVRQVQAA